MRARLWLGDFRLGYFESLPKLIILILILNRYQINFPIKFYFGLDLLCAPNQGKIAFVLVEHYFSYFLFGFDELNNGWIRNVFLFFLLIALKQILHTRFHHTFQRISLFISELSFFSIHILHDLPSISGFLLL